jgi:hypothetical protein
MPRKKTPAENKEAPNMKYHRKLCCMLLICSLCLALLPAVAETVSPEIDPEWVGCWLVKMGGDWGQFSMKADGTWESLVYSNNNYSSSGTYRAKDGKSTSTDVKFGDGTSTYVIQGDTAHWTIEGYTYEMHRMATPLARVPLPEAVTAASTDPILTGVWKGEEKGVYSEWTFMSDGTYEKITPADKKTVTGVFIASGGVLVIILDNEVLQGLYNPHSGAYMELVFGGNSIFPKKEFGGKLVQIGDPG